ncbi:4-diphosphocytidyl-2-C-methyl-D-erythritol kinase [Lyticum sinuosum]|uniref:4-diphosphocytidyl-2-C-methyl-D-erythritol kinase n=2 Tax=Lyticum sinuosum TaxID=1332059 RepID=A0AAE4VJT7_9RICK|nr:4-diphosphocytidyl-2-C-methyl-D-erythritol kinase [Lyticum sinuosum]
MMISPAKINLYLKINNIVRHKKEFSPVAYYHMINSFVFKTNQLYDTVYIEIPRASDEISCCFTNSIESNNNDLTEILEKDNIAYKAAVMLKNYVIYHKIGNFLEKKKLGAKINIEKKIPIAAGLGGGSSNAASVLLALNKMWDLRLDSNTLCRIGCNLGYDVPLFIRNEKTMVITGLGNIISSKHFGTKIFIVLVNPRIKLNTNIVYDTYDRMILVKDIRSFKSIKKIYQKYLLTSKSIKVSLKATNDLQKVAIKICPKINELIDFFYTMNGIITSKMSGSGSTCFGLFNTYEEMKTAAEKIFIQFPLYWIHMEELII